MVLLVLQVSSISEQCPERGLDVCVVQSGEEEERWEEPDVGGSQGSKITRLLIRSSTLLRHNIDCKQIAQYCRDRVHCSKIENGASAR